MKVFIHAHSPFDLDCNIRCGWYELGKQITEYKDGHQQLRELDQ